MWQGCAHGSSPFPAFFSPFLRRRPEMLQGKGDLRLSSITHLGGIVTMGSCLAPVGSATRVAMITIGEFPIREFPIRDSADTVRRSRRTQPECRRPGIQRRTGERSKACAATPTRHNPAGGRN